MDPEKKLPEDPDRFERKSVKEAIRGPLIKCSAWYPQSDLSLLLGSQTQHLATGGERERWSCHWSTSGILMNAAESEQVGETRAVQDDTNESYPAVQVYVINAQHRANVWLISQHLHIHLWAPGPGSKIPLSKIQRKSNHSRLSYENERRESGNCNGALKRKRKRKKYSTHFFPSQRVSREVHWRKRNSTGAWIDEEKICTDSTGGQELFLLLEETNLSVHPPKALLRGPSGRWQPSPDTSV